MYPFGPDFGFGRRRPRNGPIFFDEDVEEMYCAHQHRQYANAQQAHAQFGDRHGRRGRNERFDPRQPERGRPFHHPMDRETNARASASGGTGYAACTQEQIDVLQKSILDLHEGFRTFPPPVQMRQAISGFQALHSVQRTEAAAAALRRIKALVIRTNLGRDVVFKCFNDFDKALFGGVLRNRILLRWKHPPTPDAEYSDMLARSRLHPRQERVIILLNSGKLSGSSKELWGALLHELVHAYLEILTGQGLSDRCQAQPTRHPRVYWNMLDMIDYALGGVIQLNAFDREQINHLRHEREERERHAQERARPRAHFFGARDFDNDFQAGDGVGAGGDFGGGPGHGFPHDHHERAFPQEHAGGHDWFDEAGTDEQPGEGFPGAGFDGGLGGGDGGAQERGRREEARREGNAREDDAREGGARAAPNQGAEEEKAPDDVDPYKTLGIGKNAGLAEIKKAYQELSLRNHPDKVKAEDREAANERMQIINLAKEILSDPEKRSRFDRTGTWK
ncbi:hypothetical protein W97_05773 [Coniosporium apollinis CBS 100218]|uniref:J domain-containing protein n=1 Tax=Coniosporium apollinis (strain CBS 100218) TaxID=1168221 RepID=R7YXE8_CONA1|nr:uncharacterized protein W97_05773 [Coniosporium apollinis CBS 100218]EON66528.1 hypothetical protein W97_05773 [Coniosporium apollinis CBS 100218]